MGHHFGRFDAKRYRRLHVHSMQPTWMYQSHHATSSTRWITAKRLHFFCGYLHPKNQIHSEGAVFQLSFFNRIRIIMNNYWQCLCSFIYSHFKIQFRKKIENANRKLCIDRFPARPYIEEANLTNQTAIIYGNVTFNCPVIADIAAHITWARYHAFNNTDTNFTSKSSTVKLEVYCLTIFLLVTGSCVSYYVGLLGSFRCSMSSWRWRSILKGKKKFGLWKFYF